MTARKMELPTVAARKSKGYYWNRQMHFACLTLVLMMAAFAALYCGVYFGLKDDRAPENNVTSNDENRISISPHSVEINPPPTPSQPTTYSNENVRNNATDYSAAVVVEGTDGIAVCCPSFGLMQQHAKITRKPSIRICRETSLKMISSEVGRFCKLSSTHFGIERPHPLIEQFVCQAAQPECRQDGTIGPCRQLCLDVAKACDPHIWSILEKEKNMFNCDQYAEPDNLNLCYNSRPISSS
uniref:FZ domain-containing protein n=1 Tax=Daphnia galeata TaxID=27404 RepID=A0A8J2S1B3_9CRUS|nr:unnamed protein product [Daphnia galeata]